MKKEDLKIQLKKIRDEVKEKLKYEAVKLGATAVLLSTSAAFPNRTEANNDSMNIKTEILETPNVSPAPAMILEPEDIKIVPVMVNEAPEEKTKPSYMFHNKVVNSQGEAIDDFEDATKYSIWDITYMREVSNETNPVGVFRGYGGVMQYDFTNASSMMMFAILHPNFEHIGNKFFNKTAGFEQALKNLKKDYEEYGNFVFHAGNKKRQAMKRYLLEEAKFKKVFTQEGKENPSEFLDLQRHFASDVYTSYDQNGINKIIQTLSKNGIKIEDVSWAIVGMWCARHIAAGGFSSINETLVGKSLKEINSEQYIDALAEKFPKIFKQGSGKLAYKFAKQHFQEPRSITTVYELSLMTQNPRIYKDYLKLLSQYQKQSLSYTQALAKAEEWHSAKLSAPNDIGLTVQGKHFPTGETLKISENKNLSALQMKYIKDSKLTR